MLPRQVEVYSVDNFYGGLNLADSPNSLSPTQAIKLQNFQFGNGNILQIRGGTSLEHSITLGESECTGVWRYGDNSGNYYLLATNNGYFVGWPEGIETYYTLSSTTTATASASKAVTSGYYSDWQPYIDNVYHSNGADNQIVFNNTPWANGFYLRRTGCPSPTATTAGATAATGTANGDIPKGVYGFMWTLELNDGEIICEGNPNLATPVTVELASQGKITVSITDPDSEDLRQTINLYATDTDGEIYYYLTSMPITAGAEHSYTWDNYTYLDTTTEIETDNYRPPIGTVNRLWSNFMCISGVALHPHFIYFSKFDRLESFPGNVSGGDPVTSAYVLDVEDTVMGMEVAANGSLIVICKNSVQLISGYSASNFSRTYLSKSTSCINKRAIALGNDGKIFWVGRDNVYATDGASVIRIGRQIWSEFGSLSATDILATNCFFFDNRFYISYRASSSSSACDRLLEFDTRYGAIDENGNTTSLGAWLGPHVGIHCACFTKTQYEDEAEAYFGDATGPSILQFNFGNDDNGTTIEAELRSGILYLGGPLITKRFQAIGFEVQDCSSTNMLTLDIDNGNESVSFPISTEVITDLWLDDTSESASTDPMWYADDITGYDTTYCINWSGSVWGYFKHGLPQRATGDCVQIKIYVNCVNSSGTADRNFVLRNLGLLYTIIRRTLR